MKCANIDCTNDMPTLPPYPDQPTPEPLYCTVCVAQYGGTHECAHCGRQILGPDTGEYSACDVCEEDTPGWRG